jgi:hypothetical protein
MVTTRAATLSYLNPYKPGSPPSVTKDLGNQLYNQDHMI